MSKTVLAIASSFLIFIIGASFFLTGKMAYNSRSSDEKILMLQKQVAMLQESIEQITGESQAVALSLQEISNRALVREKSQDEILTEAVAKASPSVVSIVIAKDVPELEIVWENPFGDDPFYKDYDIRIPVYKQKGMKRQEVGAGTGFIITPDGYIVTNKHVVSDKEASYTALLADGSQKEAVVAYRDTNTDIAILKIAGTNLPKTAFGNSETLKLGQTVIAIGNALGEYSNSVSVGIIAGLNRDIEARNGRETVTLKDIIQTDAAINPGNSGGPLIDTEGRVVGVNVATVVGSSNISFAIPSNTVKKIVEKIIELR